MTFIKEEENVSESYDHPDRVVVDREGVSIYKGIFKVHYKIAMGRTVTSTENSGTPNLKRSKNMATAFAVGFIVMLIIALLVRAAQK